MKVLVKIGFVAALLMAGTTAYGQVPVKKGEKVKVQTEAPTSRKTTAVKPTKKAAVPGTRAKKVAPAKKIDFAPAK